MSVHVAASRVMTFPSLLLFKPCVSLIDKFQHETNGKGILGNEVLSNSSVWCKRYYEGGGCRDKNKKDSIRI